MENNYDQNFNKYLSNEEKNFNKYLKNINPKFKLDDDVFVVYQDYDEDGNSYFTVPNKPAKINRLKVDIEFNYIFNKLEIGVIYGFVGICYKEEYKNNTTMNDEPERRLFLNRDDALQFAKKLNSQYR